MTIGRRWRDQRLYPVWVLLVAAAVRLPGIGSVGLWEPHEIAVAGRANEIANQEAAEVEAATAGQPPPGTRREAQSEPDFTERAIAFGGGHVGAGEGGRRLPQLDGRLAAVSALGAPRSRLNRCCTRGRMTSVRRSGNEPPRAEVDQLVSSITRALEAVGLGDEYEIRVNLMTIGFVAFFIQYVSFTDTTSWPGTSVERRWPDRGLEIVYDRQLSLYQVRCCEGQGDALTDSEELATYAAQTSPWHERLSAPWTADYEAALRAAKAFLIDRLSWSDARKPDLPPRSS